MSVGRICHREVHVASPGETLEEAAKRMATRNVGTLVVLDERRRPIGLVTDRDVVKRALAKGKGPKQALVGRIMTKGPIAVHEETAIETALDVMQRGSFRRLPVVDDHGALLGVVTLDDILSLLAEEFALIGKLLSKEAPVRVLRLEGLLQRRDEARTKVRTPARKKTASRRSER